MAKELRYGYTTGTHATACVVALLNYHLNQKEYTTIKVQLPNKQVAKIRVTKRNKQEFFSIKSDNDDLDVTKGCTIFATLYHKRPNGLKKQTPAHIIAGKSEIYLYAASGVGIVTKRGLKTPPGYPAINPTPLKMIEQNLCKLLQNIKQTFFIAIGVENGEAIAQKTANAKVGVVGGISILGTSGVVKPVSSSAYLDSIEVEIGFALANGCAKIVLTLGNSAYNVAKERYEQSCIVEIGNYVWDAIAIASNQGAKRIVFLCGIGKLTKIAQGYKNTHNRFGTIDFVLLQRWIKEELKVEVDITTTATVKGVSQELMQLGLLDAFYKLIQTKAKQILHSWFSSLEIEVELLDQQKVVGW